MHKGLAGFPALTEINGCGGLNLPSQDREQKIDRLRLVEEL